MKLIYINRYRFIVGCIIALFLVFSLVGCKRLLLYSSEEGIRKKLLKVTPLEVSKDKVIDYIKMKDFAIEYQIEHPYKGHVYPHKKIGNSYIEVHLGEYQGIPFKTDVLASWIFNEQGELIEIKVWKEYDGL